MGKNSSSLYIKLPVIIALAICVGIIIGSNFADTAVPGGGNTNNYMKLRQVLTAIERDYVDETESDELVEAAINSVLEKLDPHSVYINAEDLELTKSQLEGEFEGIGIEFNLVEDTIFVVATLPGGPSEKVGILPGDKIVTVEDDTIAGAGLSTADIITLLRGPKGSEVLVGVKRKGKDHLLPFTISRDKIPQYSVDVSYMIDDETGYIKVSRFAATTYDEFREALEKLKDKGMKNLMIDLQDNPGGYLDRAVDMIDELLEDEAMIVYTDGKGDRYDSEYRATDEGIFENGPVVVLINEYSASASEIMAGALQDNDRALVVGRRSFGKGLVQSSVPLNDGSQLRLTISRFYTPSGRSIQKSYEEGLEDYNKDFTRRLEGGELFSADSIQFADSLAFETRSGRTVYGGGGIMPDYFVPLDTLEWSDYYSELLYSNAIREYALDYLEKNRDDLEAMSFKEYFRSFEVNASMLDALVNAGEAREVAFDSTGFARSKDLIQISLKATIARNIWGDEGYYPILNQANDTYVRGLKLFKEAGELASVK
ncbi:S41 family peptidase [Roseivirga sp. BDSF3-8]|uniref:S41 family peptidase n=1 Tax=Roseivirga sp. BDSF3-8 TaxID=3241598 RepID=UPI00353245F7